VWRTQCQELLYLTWGLILMWLPQVHSRTFTKMVNIKCYDAGALLISTLTVHVLGFGTVDSGHLCLSG
jgi:hypothetical protein